MIKVKELIDLYNKDLDCVVNVEVNGDSRNIEKYYDLEVSTFTVSNYDGSDKIWLGEDFNRRDMTVNLYNIFTDDFEDININRIYMVDGKDLLEFIFSDWEYNDYYDEECALVWDRNAEEKKEETAEDKANKIVDDFLDKYGIDREDFADFVEKMVDIIG